MKLWKITMMNYYLVRCVPHSNRISLACCLSNEYGQGIQKSLVQAQQLINKIVYPFTLTI